MRLNKKTAICFHGFLGSGHDFKDLQSSFEIFSLDLKPKPELSEEKFESWESMLSRTQKQLLAFLNKLNFANEIVFFSYSMGSKVLFDILDPLYQSGILQHFEIKPKFVWISTHFGIYQSEDEFQLETNYRKALNHKFLEVLENAKLDQFLKEWNELTLFKEDKPVLTDWSLNQIKCYFQFWNRNQSQSLIPAKLLDKGFFFYVFCGSEDEKYMTQMHRLQNLKNANLIGQVLSGRSHRLIESEDFKFILRTIDYGF